MAGGTKVASGRQPGGLSGRWRSEKSFTRLIAEHEANIQMALQRIAQHEARIARSKGAQAIELTRLVENEQRLVEKWQKDIQRNTDYLNIVRALLNAKR